jgi:hypothetical protein
MPSQEIGQRHEALVENLLHSWGVDFRRSHLVKTVFGTPFRLDFWLPPTANRGPVVIECKDFGVEVKSVSNSRRRKAQESFRLLAHVKRHCEATAGARIIIVSRVRRPSDGSDPG